MKIIKSLLLIGLFFSSSLWAEKAFSLESVCQTVDEGSGQPVKFTIGKDTVSGQFFETGTIGSGSSYKSKSAPSETMSLFLRVGIVVVNQHLLAQVAKNAKGSAKKGNTLFFLEDNSNFEHVPAGDNIGYTQWMVAGNKVCIYAATIAKAAKQTSTGTKTIKSA